MSVLLDNETVVLEGLDFEVPCQLGEHAATCVAVCRACGVECVLCEAHVSEYRAWVTERLARGSHVCCKQCTFQMSSFVDGIKVVPL